MFDPETDRAFVYKAGKWVETNESDCLDEIRFRTVELSMSEMLISSDVSSEGNCERSINGRNFAG